MPLVSLPLHFKRRFVFSGETTQEENKEYGGVELPSVVVVCANASFGRGG
jgi:hypothetical protein